MPSLTVITIVKDHLEGMRRTIESVISQTFEDFEYVAVDGNSRDGTLELISANREYFSEVWGGHDQGIYRAMNVGLREVKGEYVIYMNAGDVFASYDALEKVFAAVEGSPDIIYGDYAVNYGYLRRHVKGLSLDNIWKGMLTSHQAFLIKYSVLKDEQFDPKVSIGADFDLIYRLYKKGCSFQYVPVEIAETEPGGLSDRKRVTVYRNHLETVGKYGITLGQRMYYVYCIASSYVKLKLKKILPESLVRKIIAMKVDR